MSTTLVPVPSASRSTLARQDARELTQILTRPARRTRRRGTLFAVVLLVLIGGWAALVPLASGVVAPARVVVEGERKQVQHPTGGVVSEILVAEGTRVAAGAPVLRLRDPNAEALSDVVASQVDGLKAEEAAILAELADEAEIAFSAELLARSSEPRVAVLLSSQRGALVAARAGRDARRRELNEREQQLRAEASTAKARRETRQAQLALVADELDVIRPLFQKGLVTRTRILGLQRAETDARGEIAALGEELLRLEATRRQLEVSRQRIEVDARVAATERLRALRIELATTIDRSKAARVAVERMTVAAPVAGKIVGLKIATVGGVISPGETLMEIVPQHSRLVVEARVRPQDADDVQAQLPVTVRFAALDNRRQVYLDGMVEVVSADVLSDQRTGESYFRAVAAVDPAAIERAGLGALKPGLPAEMLIRTGQRTALQYLLEPLELGTFRALRN